MIPPLQEVDPVIHHPLDQPVLLSQAAGTYSWGEVLERFEQAQGGLHPVAQVFKHQVIRDSSLRCAPLRMTFLM
jgi:hypothetical protein